LFEFKVVKHPPSSLPEGVGDVPSYVEKKLEEAKKQVEKYEWYDRKYVIVIDLEKVEVLVEKV